VPCAFGHVFAIVVLFAMWIGGEGTVITKLIWTGVLALIWIVSLFWPYAFLAMPLYAGAAYFTFFGSERGRRWRP
jgi:hypothetical protein